MHAHIELSKAAVALVLHAERGTQGERVEKHGVSFDWRSVDRRSAVSPGNGRRKTAANDVFGNRA
jgi:hypothetical protein